MKKKAIYISILLSFAIVIIFILINIYGFNTYNNTLKKSNEEAKQTSSNDRYIISELDKETFKEVNYSNTAISSLSYEDFIKNESLVAIDTNAIPYLKDVREDMIKKSKDATLEISEYDKLSSNVDVRTYKMGKILSHKESFNNQSSRPNVTNPFGTAGQVVAKSRTIAQYNSDSIINVSPGEAWIIAHERNLSGNINDYSRARIDKVQSAMWKFKGVTDSGDNFGKNIVAQEVANNLCQEAKWMDEYAEKTKNQDTLLKDNMENIYGTEEAGVVSYNEETKEYLVGPFSINYIRDVHYALNGGLSEMISDKQGASDLIIYSGIIGANIYVLIDGKEQVLTDWNFVYNDVVEKDGEIYRTALVNSDEYGDVTTNIYPFPNEEFYIRFIDDNNNIEAITKLEFIMQTLNSEGKAKKLIGSYNNVNWKVYETLASKDNAGYVYEAWVEDELVSNESAASLYQIIEAKIYSTTNSIKIKVGNKNQGYKYTDYCIPLTMDIGGTVWIDGTEEEEARGIVDGIINTDEQGKSGVTVNLYNNVTGDFIASTITDSKGKYLFKYVQLGYKYYVEFEYDWMKYKATKELYTNGFPGLVGDYMASPEKYLFSSHAKENAEKRKDFNQKFYEITTDVGIGKNGNQTPIDYVYEQSSDPYYQIATVQEFREKVNTKECGLIFPLQTKYSISKGGAKNLVIGNNGICAITTINNDENLEYRYNGGEFLKIQEYLSNINLGLIERAPADFEVKSDVVSTTLTINESYSNQNIGFDSKKDLEISLSNRNEEYVNKNYVQEISVENYTWRHDFTENVFSKEEDELQVYVLYEYVIENKSPLLSGYITELSNFYDKEYMYPVDNDQDVKNYYKETTIYMDYAIDFMSYPSYIMQDNEIIKQVEWKSTSKFGDSNGTNMNKMYTESLSDILLEPGEKISIFVYYKVNREEINVDTPTEYKYGNYIILDNETTGKKNIIEINGYRSLDYVEKDVNKENIENVGGSRVDCNSNPGDLDSNKSYIENYKNYEADTDFAPMLRIVVNESREKEISGYVWEDLRTEKLPNNQWVGNSQIDDNEKYIDNILVELIRLEYDPDLETYEEVKFSSNYEKFINATNNDIKTNYGAQYANGEISLIKIKRRTGPQEENESLQDTGAYIKNGQYRFSNLIESGKYKVRFTYGDEEQFKLGKSSIIYNGHDYKSTEFKGFYDQNLIETELSNVNIEDSAKIKLLTTNSEYQAYANELGTKLYNTHGNFEIENRVMGRNTIDIIKAVDELINVDENSKILVLLVDVNLNDILDPIKKALDNDITVIIAATNNVNSNIYNITSNGKSVIYFDTLNNDLTLREVYNRIISNVLDKNFFVTTHNQAIDVIENSTTVNGDIYGRIDVMLKSQIMDYDVAEVLAIQEILDMESGEEKDNLLKRLSEFKMSAESYPVSITYDDNDNIKHINLGLQKIPESSLELSKEVDNIVVTLANNEKIIDLKNQNVKNVQHFTNNSYNIYMDKELMHGATIKVTYKINITNLGEIDSLITYLKYYPFDIKKKMYERLVGSSYNVNEQQLDEILSKTIMVRVNKIYDYYDNLVFRAEDNNRQDIQTNNFEILLLEDDKMDLARDEYDRLKLSLNEYLDQRLVWSEISDSKDYDVRDSVKDKINGYKCISTVGTSNIELYPFQSLEVKDEQEISSISIYVSFSKTIGGEDFVDISALEYRNFAEIIETYSINGRRDKDSSVGNLIPTKYMDENETDEKDSDHAEIIKILPPFGENTYVLLRSAVFVLIILGCIIYIIRKRKHYKEGND